MAQEEDLSHRSYDGEGKRSSYAPPPHPLLPPSCHKRTLSSTEPPTSPITDPPTSKSSGKGFFTVIGARKFQIGSKEQGQMDGKTMADLNVPIQEKALDAIIAFLKAVDADASKLLNLNSEARNEQAGSDDYVTGGM